VLRLLAFVAASAGIALFSRRSLRDTRSHGFFRFFAFEAIAGLGALNLPRWFADPFCARQWASWTLLTGAAPLAAHGFHLLRIVGRPRAGQEHTETLIPGFEDTSELVRIGAYRYIRHPLYSSLLLLAWGVFLKAPSRAGGALAAGASAALIGTARAEEAENLQRFGAAYREYMKDTSMFVPFIV
jgi:protein-S-isoprenylcysteine O-methyltransferase Ste14